MKFVISLLLTALLSYGLCLFLPWWTIAIAAFIVSVAIAQTPLMSFIAGFLSLFLFWGGMSWFISTANHHILSQRVSVLVLNNENPFLLILTTAFLGAAVAGFGALAGSYVHKKARRAR